MIIVVLHIPIGFGGTPPFRFPPGTSWVEVIAIMVGVTAAVMFVVWFSNYRKRRIARPH